MTLIFSHIDWKDKLQFTEKVKAERNRLILAMEYSSCALARFKMEQV
jgi:hypothetical protein